LGVPYLRISTLTKCRMEMGWATYDATVGRPITAINSSLAKKGSSLCAKRRTRGGCAASWRHTF